MKPSPDGPDWTFPNAATPPGSPSYYAVRFCRSDRRDAYAALLAWYRQIRDIACHPLDPGAARLKLDWWRQELDAITRGAARHPLAVAMQVAGVGRFDASVLRGIVDATDDEIGSPNPADATAFVAACRHTGGCLFLGLGLVDRSPGLDREACMDAGAYWAAIERIRHVAACARRLPEDLGPDRLTAMGTDRRSERLQALLAPFDPATLARSPGLPEPAGRLVAISRSLHNKMHRKGYPVADTLIDQAPLVHLWTAWRHR